MAQAVDPEGLRTLGITFHFNFHIRVCRAISFISIQTFIIASAILTKPDLVDKGAEADILQVLQGKVVPLKKGYTIVRCRGQSDINENVSLVEAIRQEKEFFAKNTHFRY